MPLSFRHARGGEIRRFLTVFLLVSIAVLAIGLAGSFVLLRRVEAQFIANQTRAAEREAAVIARFIDRDVTDGAAPQQTLDRIQSVLKGTAAQADFVCLLDEQGRVISHPDPGMIGMRWGDMDMTRLDTHESVPILNVIQSRQPVTGLQREPNEPTQLVHYEPVPGEPWTIAVHKNTAVIASEFAALRWKMLGAVVPMLVLIAFIGAGLARALGAHYERELAARNATLESRVQERTTELRNALDELQAAHERLLKGEKMHLLGELMAGIAHEINNPLAAISGYSELLAEGHAGDARKTGAIISQQTRRVASIVRNLLDFAHHRPAQRTPGSIADMLRSAEELIAAELRQAGIHLEATVSPDLPRVLMDAQQIEQVFINLIRNAAQALATQPGERRIAVRAFTDGLWVVVLISDNGPGVPADLRERIFDSFVTTKSDGTGLGLSLCKRFVESHGGRIELLADLGRPGARFQLQFSAMVDSAPVEPIAAAVRA